MSDLETETTGNGTTTFEMFGRSWTVPSKRHHSHIRQIKRLWREEGSVDADDMAAIFLSPGDYDALAALDPTEPDLDAFAQAISKALGMGDSGNSEPSSGSS